VIKVKSEGFIREELKDLKLGVFDDRFDNEEFKLGFIYALEWVLK